MVDINTLSPNARSAAMRGGVSGWGQVGGMPGHIRYMELRKKRPGRQPKCGCGCNTPKTHLGFANGVCLTSGCEMKIRRWVKEGNRG
jgi:hypothetical protein